jgi:hypothetical protein
MKCIYCAAELPQNARFCGNCGRLVDTIVPADEATTNISNVILEEQRGQQTPVTPMDALPPGMVLGSMNPNVAPIPSVQGTPSPGSVPTVAGSPSMGSLPSSPFVQSTPPPAPTPSAFTQFGSPSNAATPTPFAQPGQTFLNPYAPPSTYYPQTQPAPAPYPPFSTPPPLPPSESEKHHRQQERHREHHPKAHYALSSVAKVALIVVSSAVVLGVVAGALAAYFLTRPQPIISVSSAYHVNGTPAGATGTVLRITGQKFSGSSSITFLLDGSQAPGNQLVQSDGSGKVNATLTITSGWSQGSHIITARDASNYVTKTGISVVIVPQGQANTPGPNGAPADDTSFKVNVAVTATLVEVSQPFSENEILVVTGRSDPNGGTVCGTADHGQSYTSTQKTVNTGQSYQETSSFSCSGSYKAGKLSYTQTITSDVILFSDGSTCTLTSPQIDQQLEGSFTANHTFTGTVTYPKITSYTCSYSGSPFFHYGAQGTWTGPVTNS